MSADTTVVMPDAQGVVSLREMAAMHKVRFILAMFVDLAGKPCAKLVPAEAADEFQNEGVGFAGYAAGLLGQQPSDPDVIAIPDLSSFTPLPSVQPGLALVHCDLFVEGERWPYAPRVILAAMLAKAASRGLLLKVGAELEYFLVRRAADGSISPADTSDVAAQPCYDARSVTRMFDHLAATSEAMNSLGWGNYANDHEDANGQFEQNFQYSDAMTTADRVVTGRYLISMLAEQRDMVATFMPKPFGERTGSGLHLHLSLWDDSGPRFPGPDAGAGHLGLSTLACQFVGGLIDHACGLQALLAPTVNSYKRMAARTTTSGATWRRGRPRTAGTTARISSGCRTATASNCGPAMARPTRISRSPQCSPQDSTGSIASSIRGCPAGAKVQWICRRPCCTRSTLSTPIPWSPVPWMPPAPGWPRTTAAPSARNSSSGIRRSPPGRSSVT